MVAPNPPRKVDVNLWDVLIALPDHQKRKVFGKIVDLLISNYGPEATLTAVKQDFTDEEQELEDDGE